MRQRLLSALQFEVIQRLRERGHTALAQEAHDMWTTGRSLQNEYLGGNADLRADFDRANAEAGE